ncbi:unnamed protein product [Trichobilharzia regenti]|nr:unnamed protein product [Trichobilharzia regenti]
MSTGKQHLIDISAAGENTFHCRRICPRMGVNQRQYREAKHLNLPNGNTSVNTAQIKSSINNTINKSCINNNNNSNNNSLLERYPILRHERQSTGVGNNNNNNNNKIVQEKCKHSRRSGQVLLTGMMKSTRRPIKARHSLQNKNISEAAQ